MVGREADCKIVVVFFVALVIGIGCCALCANASCGCRTMVSVGNVEGIHSSKLACDGGDVVGVVNDPQGVAESINICNKVDFGLSLRNAIDETHQDGIVLEG